MTKLRVAHVTGGIGKVTRQKVMAYMPSPGNYSVLDGPDSTFWVVGFDYCGWTLDEYVIPRLRSGGYACIEHDVEG